MGLLDSTQNLVKITPIGTYDNVATAVTVSTADAAKLPAVPFNLTWWQQSVYYDPSDDPNAETVRCTNVNGGTGVLTVTRASEGPNGASTKNAAGAYKMILGPTSKTISDIQTIISGYRAITALRTLDTTDYIVECTSGTFNVTLPTAVGITGKTYVVKNTGSGVITVATTSSQTIDGSTTVSLSVQYTSITVSSNGSNWIVL